jgi:hypothetical protein
METISGQKKGTSLILGRKRGEKGDITDIDGFVAVW